MQLLRGKDYRLLLDGYAAAVKFVRQTSGAQHGFRALVSDVRRFTAAASNIEAFICLR